MKSKHTTRRAATALATIGLVGLLGACSDMLEVQNPGAIDDAELDTPQNIPALNATVISDFQRMYDDIAFAGALLTDEGFNGHNFTQWIEIDMRVVDPGNSILNSDIYTPLQRARASGDNLTERMRKVLGDDAGTSLELAEALAYAGYSNVILGDYFCESPVALGTSKDDANGKALTSQQIWQRSITRFDEALSIADAGKAQSASYAAFITNLANVGAARAYLQLGNNAKAIEHGSKVPASFVAWSYYDDEKGYQENTLIYATTGSGRYLGTETRFQGLNDPRVRHNAAAQAAHNPDVTLRVPRQSPSFSGYNPTTAAVFDYTTDIRFSSGLEAQYIVAEAQGPTAATKAFVDARRASVGAAALPATATGAQIMAELREQRSRDFYLDGHRLGDLRRYLAQGVNDPRHVFPSGTYPTAARGNYGTATCFVPPIAESIGNPAY